MLLIPFTELRPGQHRKHAPSCIYAITSAGNFTVVPPRGGDSPSQDADRGDFQNWNSFGAVFLDSQTEGERSDLEVPPNHVTAT
jgi:hypothetical protein